MTEKKGRYTLDVHLDHPDGYYRPGERVVCTACLFREGKPAAGLTGRYTVRFERRIIASGVFDGAREAVLTAGVDKPGWLYFGFEVLGGDGAPLRGPEVHKHPRKPTIVGEIGAVIAPQEIRAIPSAPADFDSFWDACRTRLRRMPFEPGVVAFQVPGEYRGRVECYAVEVPCPGKTPVTGYMALPSGARPGTLPALVGFQSLVWADASPREAMRAALERQALVLFPSWHGLPTGRPDAYYEDRSATWYEEGGRAGDTDPETWFYHDMFLRVLRALDFIKSLPQWNGKDLIVQGGSLGGAQAIAAAALEPRVTLAVISVPAFCEFNGYLAGRDSALCYRGQEGVAHIQADARRSRALAYHDAVNFAPRIQCEIFVCTGFTDELCTPGSVFAFFNALPEEIPKTMHTNPWTGHYGTTPNVKGNRRLAQLFDHIKVL